MSGAEVDLYSRCAVVSAIVVSRDRGCALGDSHIFPAETASYVFGPAGQIA